MGKKHIWEVVFWKNSINNCPAGDTMGDFKNSNPDLHEFICEKMRKFSEDWPIKTFLKSKYIEDLKNGLYEYKITASKIEFRMLGVIEYPTRSIPEFQCFHCFAKKRGKISKSDMNLALKRLKEYKNNKSK